MSTFKRIAVSNRHLCRRPLPEQVRSLAGKVDCLILREKDLTEEAYEQLAEQVQAACRDAGIQMICHTFTGAAERIGCSRIHLTFRDFMEQRHELKEFETVGVSAHSLEEVLQVQSAGADYVTVSNIFETDCKAGLPGKGIPFLEQVCRSTSIEVYGLGGITAENEEKIRMAGAAGACRMSDYMK